MPSPRHRLQVLGERFDLVQKVDHVRLLQAGVLQHQAKEVGQLAQRLVRDHHGALLDHALLDLRRHLMQTVVELAIALHFPQTGRHIPEANVGALGTLEDELESRTLPHLGREELGHAEDLLDMRLQTLGALRLPHEPELKDIRSSAALDVLVAGVEGCVIELVLLEQVCRIGRMALGQHLLVTRQEGGTLLRGSQQLVWIPSDRISPANIHIFSLPLEMSNQDMMKLTVRCH